MGYKVIFNETEYGYYETKPEAYNFIKDDLCNGKMPYVVRASSEGMERFNWGLGVISIIPASSASEEI